MDWKNWKTWTAIVVALGVLYGIYVFGFAAPAPAPAPVRRTTAGNGAPATATSTAARTPRRTVTPRRTAPPGVEPIRFEWLQADSSSYIIRRNLFDFRQPPPPAPPAPPPPPPDKDKDGVPDFRDNCVAKANPDQQDIDRDGIGTACDEPETAPPPPPPPEPQPPAFNYRYLGTFGSPRNPIATFSGDGEIVNARVGETIGGRFILRSIGIESVEIGFTGFPPNKTQRIAIGQ